MKVKRPKRRFLTANEIRDEIDRYRAKALKLMQSADALDIAARELMKVDTMVEDAKYKASQARKCRTSAARIIEKKLPRLKEKLSEFLTEPLKPIIPDGDRSVEV